MYFCLIGLSRAFGSWEVYPNWPYGKHCPGPLACVNTSHPSRRAAADSVNINRIPILKYNLVELRVEIRSMDFI